MTPTIEGGCRCGAVRYAATGQPSKVCYCHCDSCRMATAAPVAVNVMYEEADFRFTRGQPRLYESSPGVQRGFCATCGTPLTWRGVWHDKAYVFFYAATADQPELLVPDRHAFCDYQLEWFEVADDLPRYGQTSPEGEL